MTALIGFGIVAAYLLISFAIEVFCNTDGAGFFWPIALVALVVVGPPFLAYKGMVWTRDYFKNRNKVPEPEDIVRGVVATAVLRHPEKWGNNRWNYKNIQIDIDRHRDAYGKDSGYYCTARLSGVDLGYCEKMKTAIEKSYEISEKQKETKEKAERSQRMLDGLEEFMQ